MSLQLKSTIENCQFLFFIRKRLKGILLSWVGIACRVSTKWVNLLRKICAIFAQNVFCELLRMKRNKFCAVLRYFFEQFAQTRKYFFRKLGAWNEILVLGNFFAQIAENRKFYAKCNFLGKLSKIDILSLELNN